MNSFALTKTNLEWVAGSIRVFYQQEMIARLEYENNALIRWIWVEPQYRRYGVAKMMLSEVERRTGLVAYPMPPVSILAQVLFK